MSTSNLKPDSLAYSLLGAAQTVNQVLAGSALPQALARIITPATPTQARGAIQDIAYRTMRRVGRAEKLLHELASKPPDPALLHALLCCALSLISDPDTSQGPAPYNEFTVVDQAVTAATNCPEIAHAKGMVNAVLRRFLRERDALLAKVLQDPVAAWNYPGWWIDAVRTAYPADWSSILQAGNTQPPLTLRVNRSQTDVASYLQLLAGAGMPATQIGPWAVRLAQPIQVHLIPGFEEGLVSVQDAAAQQAATLLDLHDGQRVLDACAAPGGKTCHILETAAVDLTAIDSDMQRIPRIRENLERLHLKAQLKTGNAMRDGWWNGQPFDRILADVPCTASGIVRRHPDIRWLRRTGDASQLATVSAQILDNLWRMLRPDGKLLFVTCSVWPQESTDQAAAFEARHGAIRLPAPGQLMPTANGTDDHDGLFYALFQKPAA